jgi:hypothetical protein
MDKDFANIIRHMVSEQGKDVLVGLLLWAVRVRSENFPPVIVSFIKDNVYHFLAHQNKKSSHF